MLWEKATRITQRELGQSPPRRRTSPPSFPGVSGPATKTRRAQEAKSSHHKFSFKPNAVSCLINRSSSNRKLLLYDLNFLRKAKMTSFSRAIKKEHANEPVNYLTVMKSSCRFWWQRCNWAGFLWCSFNTLQKNFLCTLLFCFPLLKIFISLNTN